MSKNITRSDGKFKLGIDSDSSGDSRSPYNDHLYLGRTHYSLSLRRWFFPVRFSFGSGDMGGEIFLRLGLLSWNLTLGFRDQELTDELLALGVRIKGNSFFLKLEKISGKRKTYQLL